MTNEPKLAPAASEPNVAAQPIVHPTPATETKPDEKAAPSSEPINGATEPKTKI